MMIAIATATIAGLIQFVQNYQQQQQQHDQQNDDDMYAQPHYQQNNHDHDNNTTHSSSSSRPLVSRMSTFAADMSSAFEGNGLVLPVENSFSAGW